MRSRPHKPRVSKTIRHPAVLWFTGLSGSGKSTIAAQVVKALSARHVAVELLDGDTVRAALPGTGFTRKDRDQHITRVGYMASLLEKHGVLVVATFVSPYRKAREAVRRQCRSFVEIHVATPIEECERRDVKGLYAKARHGTIAHFTGVSDPYEPPANPELAIDTTGITVREAADRVLRYLEQKVHLPRSPGRR